MPVWNVYNLYYLSVVIACPSFSAVFLSVLSNGLPKCLCCLWAVSLSSLCFARLATLSICLVCMLSALSDCGPVLSCLSVWLSHPTVCIASLSVI
jgi:hypothetical protein